MKIRKAIFHDAPFIKLIMQDMANHTSISLLVTQLNASFSDSDHEVWVFEDRDMVSGFVIIHCLPKLGSENGLLIVSGLLTNDHDVRNALERHVTDIARKRNCDRVDL